MPAPQRRLIFGTERYVLKASLARHLLTAGVTATCIALLSVWLLGGTRLELSPRLPEEMNYSTVTVDLTGAWKEGRLERGASWDMVNGAEPGDNATLADFAQSWPQFRGPLRDGRATPQHRLLRQWPAGGPQELWRMEVGEGHAGVAIDRGRVYLIDYDKAERRDVIRCLSLTDGSEIWSYSYPIMIKWNYGMSRTVPAVVGDYVVAIGPLGHVHCLDARTGELKWRLSMIEAYESIVPSWYMGQCVLVDEDKVILAPGGVGGALLVALSLADGTEVWRTVAPPSAAGTQWLMTHSSIMPMDIGGVRQYVYAATAGVISVAADDGRLLWRYDDWRVPIATVPSPLQVAPNRVMLAAGYDAGMTLLAVERQGDGFVANLLKHVGADVFGVEQQTPIRHEGNVYAI